MSREYQHKNFGTYNHSKLITAIQLVKTDDSVYKH